MVKSNFTGKSYDPSKCCRIVNMLQLAFYMENNVELLDLFVSKDHKDSYEAYKMWCDNKTDNYIN